MKVWVIFLSLIAAIGIWHWGPPRRPGKGKGVRSRGKQVVQSLIAGVAVYFSIMSLAMLYLMLTQA